MEKLVYFTVQTHNNTEFQSNQTSTISNPLLVYCTISVVTILVGIIVNTIVIAAYKLGDRKITNNNNSNNVNNNNTSTNLNKLIYSLNENIKKNEPIKSLNTQNRRVSLSVTPITNSKKQLLKRHEETDELSYSKSDNFDKRKAYQKRRFTSEFQSRSFISNNNHPQMGNLNSDNLASNRHRRTVCSYFILSLGCCDLLICILNMPFNLIIESGLYDLRIREFFATDSNSDMWCKLSYFLSQIPIVLEIEILLTIAIDRYSSVFHPIKFYFFDKNKSKLTLIAQILISCLISVPNLVFFTSFKSNKDSDAKLSLTNKYTVYSMSNYCRVKENYIQIYSYYQLILFCLFILNLTFIIIFYIKVYKHIYKVSKHQRIESINSRASACTNSSIFLNNQSANSNISVGLTTKQTDKQSLFNNLSKYLRARKKVTKKEIELETSLKNIEEFEINEEKEVESIEEEKSLISETIIKSNEPVSEIDDYLYQKKAPDTLSEPLYNSKMRRVSCPLAAISDEKKDDKTVPVSIDLESSDTLKQNIQKTRLKVLNKRIRTSSTRSNEISNLNSTKWRSSVINRLRRFSENHNSMYSRSSSSNQNYIIDFQNGNMSNATNTLLFRRHTTKIFKHGKTARILGIATLAFTLTWSPYWYYTFKYSNFNADMYNLFIRDKRTSNIGCFILFKFIKNSFYLNYVLNPLFYSFVNQRFRKNVYILFHLIFKFISKYLCCCFCYLKTIKLFSSAKNDSAESVLYHKKQDFKKKERTIIVIREESNTKRSILTNGNNDNRKTCFLFNVFNKICCFCCSKYAKKYTNDSTKF